MKDLKFKLTNLQLFAEETKTEPQPGSEPQTEPQPGSEPVKSTAELIKEMKENSVDKAKYDALQKDMNDLVKSVLNGEGLKSASDETKRTADDIRKEMFDENGKLTNLEFAKDALELRELLMKEGKPDPFLQTGTNVEITSDDIAKANNLAECLKHCVEYANGDSETFTVELMRLTKDIAIPKRSR